MPDDNIWLSPTEVRDSTIHGRGRFTIDNIKSNSIIGIIIGDIIPIDGKHLPILGTGYCIRCPNTIINHDRNSTLFIEGQIVIKAKRDIDAGEELTLDYRTLTSSIADFY